MGAILSPQVPYKDYAGVRLPSTYQPPRIDTPRSWRPHFTPGWGKAVVVGLMSAALWIFNLGRSEAEYVKRPELAKALVENTQMLDRLRMAVETHSNRITALEVEMRLRNQQITPAPLRVTP